MIFAGSWATCEDGVVRPVFHAHIATHDRSWREVDLLVDTGDDRTVLIWPIAVQLGLQPIGSRDRLTGLGGVTGSVQLATTIRLTGTAGELINFVSHYPALTDPQALDMSVLGRDILDQFSVILDRRRRRVWLVGSGHDYGVVAG